MNTENVVLKKSKGEQFKEDVGWSKTMQRNMRKNDIRPSPEGLNEYRALRSKRRAEQKKLAKAHKQKIHEGRKVKGGILTKKK